MGLELFGYKPSVGFHGHMKVEAAMKTNATLDLQQGIVQVASALPKQVIVQGHFNPRAITPWLACQTC